MDTIVSFVIQSWQVSEGRAIFVTRHVNFLTKDVFVSFTEIGMLQTLLNRNPSNIYVQFLKEH